MKTIINEKLYSTETAVEIAEDSFSYPGNFQYWQEILYRKTNGEFFLFGEGGAMSRYSRQIDTNSWGSGETIIPYTAEEAKEWLVEHGFVDTYVELFGMPEE